MCIVFIEVLRTPYDVDHPEKGHLIDALNREMTTKENPWDIEFNNEDILELENFLKLMKPMMTLFTTLNSELESTIHRVYPSVKVTNIFNVLSAHCYVKLYIIKALLRSLSPFLENERGRVDTSLRNKSRNKLRSTLLLGWTQLTRTPCPCSGEPPSSFQTTGSVLSPEQRKVATTYLKGISII